MIIYVEGDIYDDDDDYGVDENEVFKDNTDNIFNDNIYNAVVKDDGNNPVYDDDTTDNVIAVARHT